MFAVVQIGSKQFKISKDDLIQVEFLNVKVGEFIKLNKVLLLGNMTDTLVGTPYIANSNVVAQVLEQSFEKKSIFYKRKANKIKYQPITLLKILKV